MRKAPELAIAAAGLASAAFWGELVKGSMTPFCTVFCTWSALKESRRDLEVEPFRLFTISCSSCITYNCNF